MHAATRNRAGFLIPTSRCAGVVHPVAFGWLNRKDGVPLLGVSGAVGEEEGAESERCGEGRAGSERFRHVVLRRRAAASVRRRVETWEDFWKGGDCLTGRGDRG